MHQLTLWYTSRLSQVAGKKEVLLDKKTKVVLQAAAIVVSFLVIMAPVARAEAPNYSYLEAGYLNVNPDDLEDSGDNWFAGASVGLFKNFHINGRYIDGDYAPNIDFSYWDVGAGWHGLLGEQADLLAEAHWVDTSVADFDDNGYRLVGGVRWRPVKVFELAGLVNWTNFDEGDSVDSYEIRGMVHVWKFALGATYEFQSEVEQWGVFARFNFGN